MKTQIFKEVKENSNDFNSDVLYIESVIGTFSLSELTPVVHETDKKDSLKYLQLTQNKFKKIINND